MTYDPLKDPTLNSKTRARIILHRIATARAKTTPPETAEQRLARLWKKFIQSKKVVDLLDPRRDCNDRDPSIPDQWLPHRYAEEEMRRSLRLWLAERRRQMTPAQRVQSDQRAALRSKTPFHGEP